MWTFSAEFSQTIVIYIYPVTFYTNKMTDFSAQFANRFESSLAEQNQPATDLVNARLQRLDELQRLRQERLAESTSNNGNDASSRMQRRERLIRQSTQSRSMERRSFASNIQRTPVVRSQTLHTDTVNEDTLSFRDVFEGTRQNLFRPRVSASSENLSAFHRSSSDTRLMSRVPAVVTNQESDSGSSTPRALSRPSWDIASGLAEAFSSVRSSLMRQENSHSVGDVSRSPSMARETRNTSTNVQRFMMSSQNAPALSRSASVRESRRETRFRRRTIEGVDSNVTRALERERAERINIDTEARSSAISRSQSFNRMRSSLRSQVHQTVSETSNNSVNETSVTETTTEAQSASYSSYSYTRGRRTVDLFPEDSVPVLGLEDEKVKFIDVQGQCHWLSKHHQLLRLIKSTNCVPEIKKVKLQQSETSENDGYMASLEGDDNSRYGKLRELVHIARKRDACVENGFSGDAEQRLSLLELYERGDFLDDKQNEDTENIDEKYKSVSLYNPPRSRPDLESYLSSRTIVPLYDGIEKPKSESEKKKEPAVTLVPRHPVEYTLSAARLSGRQFSSTTTSVVNGGLSTVTQNVSEAQQEDMAYSASANGQSMTYQSSEQSSFNQELLQEFSDGSLDNFDDAAAQSEVNLVMERLNFMQEAMGQPVDTSHLNYEEMLMIQRALEENPSPPETPDQMMSPGAQQWVEEVQDVPPVIPNERAPPSLHHIISAPEDLASTSRQSGSTSVRQQVSGSESRFLARSFSADDRASTERTASSRSFVQTRSSSVSSRNGSVQTVSSQSEAASEASTSQQVVTNGASSRQRPSDLPAVTSNVRSSIQGNPYPGRVSVSPRLQRISSSGSDTMLPLPTMDFSPLSRSPQKSPFSEDPISEQFTETGTNLNSGNENSVQENQNMITVSSPDPHTELTIDIPESASASRYEGDRVLSVSDRNEGHSEGGQRASSSVSPLVKTRNSSVNSTDAMSPAGSDGVTTVFEEFVQTIPKDLLNNWSPKENDKR